MSAINAISSCARGAVIASEGNELMVADLGQMEARILVWLAGQEDVLQGFRDNVDMYCRDASVIYGHEVTPKMKQKRFVGKVSRLALGYQGGIGAYCRMCNSYGVDISPIFPELWAGAMPDERSSAEFHYLLYCKGVEPPYEPVSKEIGFAANIIKDRFRAANPDVVMFWNCVETAAIQAVETGEVITQQLPYTTIQWFRHGNFLYCRLPSGRDMLYPFPKLERPKTSRGKTQLSYRHMDLQKNQWVRSSTYGGKLTENIVQAIQRDLIVGAMKRVNEAGYKIVLHVHDELVSDNPKGFGHIDEFTALMIDSEPWADGLPVRANGWVGVRYGKE